MNGFAFFQSGAVPPSSVLQTMLPELYRVAVQSGLAGGWTMAKWGAAHGDVSAHGGAEGSVLVISGYICEVTNRPDLIDAARIADFLLEHLRTDATDLALTKLITQLHGSFALLYQSRDGEIVVVTDRIASRPLYRRWTQGRWIVSTNLAVLALSAESPAVYSGGLAALMLYGGPVNPQKTLFAGLDAFPPGAIVRLQAGGGVRVCSWYRFRHAPDDTLSKADWIERVAEALTRAARRVVRSDPQPIVFFSGGVDSRLTVAALQAAGARPKLVTLADGRNLEVRCAEAAARAFGLEHQIIFRDNHWYLHQLPRAVFESNGSFVWLHAHFSTAMLRMTDFGASAFFLGDFCEAFSKLFCAGELGASTVWPVEEFANHFDRIRLESYQPRDRAWSLAFLHPKIRTEAEDALRADIEAQYGLVAGSTADPQIFSDQMFRWHSAATLPTFMMFFDVRSVGRERNLMFDPDVQSLLESLPARWRDGANLGALVIRKFNKHASAVPNSNSSLPMDWPPMAHKLSKRCKPVLGKIRRRIFGDSHRTSGSWPKKAALYTGDSAWRTCFRESLSSPNCFWDGVLDHAHVLRTLEALSRGDQQVADDLEKLVQLSLLSHGSQRGSDYSTPQPVATGAAHLSSH